MDKQQKELSKRFGNTHWLSSPKHVEQFLMVNTFYRRNLNRFARDYFGNEALSAFFREFFACYVEGDIKTDLAKSRNYSFDFLTQDVPFAYYPINDGDIRVIGRFALGGKEYKNGWPQRFEASAKKFEALLQKVETASAAPYFEEYKLMVQFMICLTRWAVGVCSYRETGDKAYLRPAAEHLQRYLEARKRMEQPPFENWYRGDDKMNIPKLYEDIQAVISEG